MLSLRLVALALAASPAWGIVIEDLSNDPVALGADYLARAVKNDGRFSYQLSLDGEFDNDGDYNMLRHAGAIYAMAAAYQRQPSPELRHSIVQAARYVQDRALGPVDVDGHEGMKAIWELDGQPAAHKAGRYAKLGGAGIALVGLLSAERAVPGLANVDDMKALGRFVLFMQKDDGAFFSRFDPKKGGRSDDYYVEYYPGEATLGLAMLAEVDSGGPWLEAVAKSLDNMALLVDTQSSPHLRHWDMLATRKFFQLGGDLLTAQRREKLVRYAAWSAQDGLKQQEQILQAAIRGVAYLESQQLKQGKLRGGILRMAQKNIPDEEFNGIPIRIDFVQHSISAMMALERTQKGLY